MRVLHVIPSVAPRYGGPSEAVVGLAAAQRTAGTEAFIATTDADGDTRLSVPIGEETEWRGVPTMFFRRHGGEALKLSPGLASWLGTNAARFDLLHVHAFFSHSVVAAAGAAKRAERPYVLRPLGTLGEFGRGRKPLRKKLFFGAFGRSVLAGAAAVHCTSLSEKLEMNALGAPRPFVVPLGVSETMEREGTREKTVLFLGRLAPKKCVEELIAAFQSLAMRFPGWSLAIAGAGEPGYEAALRSHASSGPGAERIRFTGWVDGDAKAALLARASLFALPSRDENFGLAAAEAMAAGLPVVVTPEVDLASDVSAQSAGWVAPREGFAETLASAMEDEAERARRGASARLLARERFSWPRVAQELNERYEEILSWR